MLWKISLTLIIIAILPFVICAQINDPDSNVWETSDYVGATFMVTILLGICGVIAQAVITIWNQP